MKGIWLEKNQLQLRTDLPIPRPPEGEILVKVLRAGICNTDLELIRGYYPYQGVLGHEFVGMVVEGPKHLMNQRVVGEINVERDSQKGILIGKGGTMLKSIGTVARQQIQKLIAGKVHLELFVKVQDRKSVV